MYPLSDGNRLPTPGSIAVLLWLCCIIPVLGAIPASKISSANIQHVIHISVDGLGGTYLQEYLEQTNAAFPAFRRLRAEGAATMNARNDYHSPYTEPNHATILTGRPVSQQPTNISFVAPHGYTANHDPGPPSTLHTLGNPQLGYIASPFDVAHDYGFATSFHAGKAKFALFVRTWSEDYGAPDITGDDNGTQKIDHHLILDWTEPTITWQQSSNLVTDFLNWLSNAPPSYSFVHLTDPDIIGHYYLWGSAAYSNCIQHIDTQLGRLLALIDSHPGLSNQTALVLTADHGGGDVANSHIYPDARVVYTIPLMAWGPGVPAGTDLYRFFANRADPLEQRLDYNAALQPLRNGDSGALALALLDLPPIPGSCLIPHAGVSLSLTRSETGLTISWPADYPDYLLEAADSCHPDARWQPVTLGIKRTGNFLSFSPESSAAIHRFFRLRQNPPD